MTFLFTAGQMLYEYESRVDALETNLQQLEKTYVPALENALWVFNKKQIEIIVESMSKIPYVEKTEVVSLDTKMNFTSKDRILEKIKYPYQKIIPLNYQVNEREFVKLGELRISASKDEIVDELINKTSYFLLTQFIKTLLISLFILGVIFLMVIRPLQNVRSYLDQLNYQADLEPLRLNKKDVFSNGRQNELFYMQESINKMVKRINEGNAFREQTISEKVKSSKLQAIGVLTSGVAHDFNNILQGLLNLNFINLKKNKDPEIQDNLEKNVQFLDRGKSLVDSMLLFSRNKKPELQAVDLVESLKEVIDLGKVHRFGEMQIHLETNLDNAWVFSSKLFLYQVFTNLLANASDAMKEKGGEVTIKLAYSGQHFLIEISDDGPGMPAEMMEHIFDPFFTTKEVGEGTGLGLSIVYGIVKDLEGEIQVSSREGIGTTFHINFPALRAEDLNKMRPINHLQTDMMESSKQDQNKVSIDDKASNLICLIDDEHEILNIVKELLEDEGYEIRCYTCPKKFLNDLPAIQNQIRMVLTDYNMPGATGEDILNEVSKVNAGIPVFLLSGYIDETIDIDRFEGHLLKPFAPQKVIELVENHTV